MMRMATKPKSSRDPSFPLPAPCHDCDFTMMVLQEWYLDSSESMEATKW